MMTHEIAFAPFFGLQSLSLKEFSVVWQRVGQLLAQICVRTTTQGHSPSRSAAHAGAPGRGDADD
jgi:hypothetical protein